MIKIAMLLVTVLTAGIVNAESYPNKPVRVVVPLAVGGGSDIVARITALSLSAHWKQQVVVDNRPGAGGTVGNSIVARATADGYTALISSSTMAISPSIIKNPEYNIITDFAPVALLASQPSIILASNQTAINNIKELIAQAKSNPNKFNFGSAGVGTASHLANEQFLIAAGIKANHVPYKSAGLAVAGLLNGDLHFMVTNQATALPLIRNNRAKALAVTSSRRIAALPALPTVTEVGLQDAEYSTWYAMLVPTKTNAAIVNQLNRDVNQVLSQQEVKSKFEQQGLETHNQSPQQFSAMLRREVNKWAGVVQLAKIN